MRRETRALFACALLSSSVAGLPHSAALSARFTKLLEAEGLDKIAKNNSMGSK